MKPVTAILIGAGARGQVYAQYAGQHPEELKIVGVAEPKTDRREMVSGQFGIPEEARHSTWETLLEQPRMADAAFICTLDAQHTRPVLAALEKGYHVLLEKPMSNTEEECRAIAEAAEKAGKVLSVCHVLRYTPFYRTLKKLLDSGRAGEVMTVSQIENVAYWHYAHSFVRGNWRSSRETSAMILQKSCHDMDILLWLMAKDCRRVSSFGSLRHFDESHAPKGAPSRCLDGCPDSGSCPYYAPRLYQTGNTGWPVDMLTTDTTPEGIGKALREGPYGRCVYRCDNDVVDHQTVILEFEGGGTADFTMTAFTTDSARQLKITGTQAQITADMEKGEIWLHRFDEAQPQRIPVDMPVQTNNYGHGGGDYYLVRDFVREVRGEGTDSLSSARVSLQSHLICFAAERSRLEKTVVEL